MKRTRPNFIAQLVLSFCVMICLGAAMLGILLAPGCSGGLDQASAKLDGYSARLDKAVAAVETRTTEAKAAASVAADTAKAATTAVAALPPTADPVAVASAQANAKAATDTANAAKAQADALAGLLDFLKSAKTTADAGKAAAGQIIIAAKADDPAAAASTGTAIGGLFGPQGAAIGGLLGAAVFAFRSFQARQALANVVQSIDVLAEKDPAVSKAFDDHSDTIRRIQGKSASDLVDAYQGKAKVLPL